MIAVSDLSVRHLRDISLTVPEGGLTLVLGANGSGKSTLLSAVAGLITPKKGRLRHPRALTYSCKSPSMRFSDKRL